MTKSDIKWRQQQHLKFSDYDNNLDRLSYWSGDWVAGPHRQYEEVYHEGAIWICNPGVMDTTEEPSAASADWRLKVPSGGRGEIELAVDANTFGTIQNGVWEPVDNYDTTSLANAGIAMTPATGVFVFSWPGIWRISQTIVMRHDEQNAAREFWVRLFNITDTVQIGTTLPVYIARNQGGSNIGLTFTANITAALLGKSFRFELSAAVGDIIIPINTNAMVLTAFQFGPLV